MTVTKVCTKCKAEKGLDQFGTNKQKKDGLDSNCKACRKKYAAAYYMANKERILAFAKAKAKGSEWRSDLYRARSRRQYWKQVYGLQCGYQIDPCGSEWRMFNAGDHGVRCSRTLLIALGVITTYQVGVAA